MTFSYEEIPHFPHATGVVGHAGKLSVGEYLGVPTAILQGRFHFYEGHTIQEVVFPTRVLCALGVNTLVLTNASGGVNTRYRAGDIMMITDHINMTGQNPLVGPNVTELGPRFPDMSDSYIRCQQEVETASAEAGVPLQYGVYGGVLGPSYETPAEVRMLRSLGADAVGMSTVAEAIAAAHMGANLVGLACVTNLAAGLSQHKLTHQEVVDNSKATVAKLESLLNVLIPKLPLEKRN